MATRGTKMLRKVYVVGVGMTKFEKPGRRADFDYPDMAKEAVTKALLDSGLSYDNIEQATVGYVYGDSTCGQRALYQMGLTGIPIFNVNNNCSTGSSALMLAKQFIEGGLAECTLALGFEKMERGSLTSKFEDRTNPMDRHVEVLANLYELQGAPIAAQLFGAAGEEHMRIYGTKPEHFAKIAYKNHLHSTRNPNSQFQDEYSLQQILSAPVVYGPLTKLQCCPTSDGSAAAILASEAFVHKHSLQKNAVEILGIEMATDLPSSFNDSMIKTVGYDMTKTAADKLYSKTGIGPKNVDVVELHDCFSTNELLTYEALGLCEPGKAGELIDSGNNTYGGKYVVNPSGGLISKGHPLGATGLAQCAELNWQLRNAAGKRQVPNAKIALQHNLGLGGAAVVTMYRHGFPQHIRPQQIGANAVAAKANTVAADNVHPEDFDAHLYFKELEEILKEEGEKYVKLVNTIYRFKIKNKEGKEGTWTVEAKTGCGKVIFGPDAPAPSVTFTINDEDIGDFITGKLDPQKAYFQGRLKIAGSIAQALRLKDLALKHKDLIVSKL